MLKHYSMLLSILCRTAQDLSHVMDYRQIFAIDDSYFTSKIALGGSGGAEFYFGLGQEQSPQSGTVIRSLRAWCSSTAMRGLEVNLTDGSNKMIGLQEGTPTETFYFTDGEKVTSLKLWAGPILQGRSGGFELITDKKRKFSVDATMRTGNPYQPELGSGILLGVFGKVDEDIHCLGFGLLRTVVSSQLVDVKYPHLSTLTVTAAPEEIKYATHINKLDVDQEFALEDSKTVETSSSWSVTGGMEFGFETEVNAAIPLLAESKVKVSAKLSVSGTYGRSNTITIQRSFNFPVKVPPREHIKATATLYRGVIKTKYTGTMVYNLDSGKSFSYAVEGSYSGVAVTQVAMAIEPFRLES